MHLNWEWVASKRYSIQCSEQDAQFNVASKMLNSM